MRTFLIIAIGAIVGAVVVSQLFGVQRDATDQVRPMLLMKLKVGQRVQLFDTKNGLGLRIDGGDGPARLDDTIVEIGSDYVVVRTEQELEKESSDVAIPIYALRSIVKTSKRK